MNNGESVFGWVKVAVTLIIAIVAGVVLWKVWGLLKQAGSVAKDAAIAATDYVTGGENDHNFVSRGADVVLGVPDGMTLGTWIYDVKEKFFGDPLENQKRKELEVNPLPNNQYMGIY